MTSRTIDRAAISAIQTIGAQRRLTADYRTPGAACEALDTLVDLTVQLAATGTEADLDVWQIALPGLLDQTLDLVHIQNRN